MRRRRNRIARTFVVATVLSLAVFVASSAAAITATRDASAVAASMADSFTGAAFTSIPPAPGSQSECADEQDNDDDGNVDEDDSGCPFPGDNREQDDEPAQCADGEDNDFDDMIDSPQDPGCASAADNEEEDGEPSPAPECSDTEDNDGDDQVDGADPGCSSANDLDEGSEGLPAGEDLNPVAVSDSPLAGFPTSGGTYAILTSGNANFADDPNTEEGLGQDNGTSEPAPREGVNDLVTLRVDVSAQGSKTAYRSTSVFSARSSPSTWAASSTTPSWLSSMLQTSRSMPTAMCRRLTTSPSTRAGTSSPSTRSEPRRQRPAARPMTGRHRCCGPRRLSLLAPTLCTSRSSIAVTTPMTQPSFSTRCGWSTSPRMPAGEGPPAAGVLGCP